MVETERKLWSRLRGRQLGWKFRRQHPLGPYFADFYCPRLRLVVEFNGLSHESEAAARHDELRQQWLEEREYRVLNLGFETEQTQLDDLIEAINATIEQLVGLPHPPG